MAKKCPPKTPVAVSIEDVEREIRQGGQQEADQMDEDARYDDMIVEDALRGVDIDD